MSARSLISRFGCNCHICGLCCDFRVGKTCNKRLRATRDHIVPRSKSGSLLDNNVILAHQYCNSKKGAGPVTDELRSKCKAWILKYVPASDLMAAQRYFDTVCVPPRSALQKRIEENWWDVEHRLHPHEEVMYSAMQGGLCKGK